MVHTWSRAVSKYMTVFPPSFRCQDSACTCIHVYVTDLKMRSSQHLISQEWDSEARSWAPACGELWGFMYSASGSQQAESVLEFFPVSP